MSFAQYTFQTNYREYSTEAIVETRFEQATVKFPSFIPNKEAH